MNGRLKYEYYVVTADGPLDDDQLGGFGTDGWFLCAAFPMMMSSDEGGRPQMGVVYTFARTVSEQ